ncbi:MAG TPA: hypothetical protein VJP89_07710 [Pyrinomonadaceae bacterium]|nr:hypothetical protein [Pyrinomonadaceae bacterium]
MKRFLCTSAFMIALAMLFILGPGKSLTAETNAIASANEPIKVLAVNLNANSQANWLEGLELQIENTSGKTINYLLLHVDVAGTKIRVPMKFGQPVGAKTSEAQILQAGAKVSLKPVKAVCDQMRQEIVAGRVPSPKDLKTNINVVMFSDNSAWKGGHLNYPDPLNRSRWIVAEDPSTVKFVKTSFKPDSGMQQCYRYTGFSLEFCCDSNYVASANFSPDANGHVQPVEAEACCGSGNCCIYTDIGTCP